MPARHSMRAPDSGFVLVGVVVFVLALTILVLSLYGLSSYEAQFFQRSLDTEQAFQSAVGGIERAKHLLTQTSSLGTVKVKMPAVEDVVAAVALQDGDSTKIVDWQGTDVTIRVTARVNGEQRTVEGRFDPHQTQNYYSKVITTSRELYVDDFASAGGTPTDRRHTVSLLGAVWEGVSPPDEAIWKSRLLTLPDSVRTTPAETPDLATYFANHNVNTATQAPYINTQVLQAYSLLNLGNVVKYFCAPPGYSRSDFYYNNWSAGAEIEVLVRGLVVWEFPHGLRFDETLHVTGVPGSDNCLVIVAGQAGVQPAPENDPEMGIRLFAGLRAEISVSVILVSNGRVFIQHMNNPSGQSSYAADFSIYAQNAWLTGPVRVPPASPPQRTMELTHTAGGNIDAKYVPLLAGALPGSSSANGNSLTFIPGTWRAHP